MFERVIPLLKQLRELLIATGGHAYIAELDSALTGDDAAVVAFLTSNTLWGGAGSIADQAGGITREAQRPVEQLLAALGREQLRIGHTNTRTEKWTSAFEHWHAENI